MQAYLNLSGDSGVTAYEIGADFIRVRFIGADKVYTYSYTGIGRHNVEAMKALAIAGKGLSAFISRHPSVRYGYDR